MKALYKLWSVRDDVISKPSVIFPHLFGITRDEKLPETSKRILDRSVELLKKYPEARLLLVSCSFFWKPLEYEWQLKIDYLKSISADLTRIVDGGGVLTTLDEIAKAISTLDLTGREVVAVCEKIHSRRVRYFWRKLAPLVKFKIFAIEGVWDKTMPSWFMRSNFRWLIGNVVNLFLFIILGKRISKITHNVRS
jgi:hypothetical protein